MNPKAIYADFFSEFQHKMPDLQKNIDANARIKMYYYNVINGSEFFINLLIYTIDSNKTYKIPIYPDGPEACYNVEIPQTIQGALDNWLLTFDHVYKRQTERNEKFKYELITKAFNPDNFQLTTDV
jgi:hypothetical protein